METIKSFRPIGLIDLKCILGKKTQFLGISHLVLMYPFANWQKRNKEKLFQTLSNPDAGMSVVQWEDLFPEAQNYQRFPYAIKINIPFATTHQSVNSCNFFDCTAGDEWTTFTWIVSTLEASWLMEIRCNI